jgi:hypothetical protein
MLMLRRTDDRAPPVVEDYTDTPAPIEDAEHYEPTEAAESEPPPPEEPEPKAPRARKKRRR